MTQSFTQNRKKWLIGLSIIVTIFVLAGYRYSKSNTQDDVLTIGISPPYAELLQSVADEVKKQGIQVKLVEFSDWHAPNVAVQNGDIDANFFSKVSFYVMRFAKQTIICTLSPQEQEVMSDCILKNISP